MTLTNAIYLSLQTLWHTPYMTYLLLLFQFNHFSWDKQILSFGKIQINQVFTIDT